MKELTFKEIDEAFPSGYPALWDITLFGSVLENQVGEIYVDGVKHIGTHCFHVFLKDEVIGTALFNPIQNGKEEAEQFRERLIYTVSVLMRNNNGEK